MGLLGTFALHEAVALGYLLVLLAVLALTPAGVERSLCLRRVLASGAVVLGAVLLARRAVAVPVALRAQIYRVTLAWMVVDSYLMLRDLLPLVRPDTVDHLLLQLDRALLGFEPTLWLERFNQRPIVEWFSFFYFSYFWLCGAFLVALLWALPSGRRTSEYALGSMLVMFLGHVGYLLVPGFGPVRHLADQFRGPIDGGFFWGCVQSTVSAAGAMKDIFPSLHTAMPTWLTLFAIQQARRDRRWWPPAMVTGFFALNIVVSTMLLRWHYAIDVVAGLVLASTAALITPRLVAWDSRRRAAAGLPDPWLFASSAQPDGDKEPAL